MFNTQKIISLENSVEFLEHERDHHRDKLETLRRHIEALCEHLGLEIVETAPNTIVRPVVEKGTK